MSGKRLLRDYVLSNFHYYVMAVLFIAAANITQSLFPKVLGNFTDDLQKGGLDQEGIVRYSLLLLGIGAAYGVIFGLGQYTIMRLGRKFEFYTRQRMFRHFSTLSEHYFSKHGIGKLLSHVMNDVTSVRESISNGVNQTTNATMAILSAVIMMLLSSIPFYLIVVCVLPLLLIPVVVVFFGPRIRARSMKVQESLATMTESAEEQFGGIRVTKTFAVEDMAQRRFGETVDRIRDNQLRLVRLSSLFQATLPFLGGLAMIITIVFGGYLTINQGITLGNFVALTLYLRQMVGPLQQIGNVINIMQRSRASLERVNTLLSEIPDIRETEKAVPLKPGASDITIRHLSFHYPGSEFEALHDLNVTVKPGQTLGIVGKTGSGKTTLVKLLLRIYDPPEGTVYIGGEDIRKLTLESLRTQIAYVPQDGFLFSTTIKDNIAFFNRKVEFPRIEQAAQQAQIYSSIVEFPQKFETRLGERGITLSGGQRQRTSLARGMIKNSPILILDDSVSAVDAVTETKIIQSLKEIRKDKTTVIIAHRISAVKHADEIIVLDEGRIVQRGTHEELLAAGGVYASLYAIQEEGTRHA